MKKIIFLLLVFVFTSNASFNAMADETDADEIGKIIENIIVKPVEAAPLAQTIQSQPEPDFNTFDTAIETPPPFDVAGSKKHKSFLSWFLTKKQLKKQARKQMQQQKVEITNEDFAKITAKITEPTMQNDIDLSEGVASNVSGGFAGSIRSLSEGIFAKMQEFDIYNQSCEKIKNRLVEVDVKYINFNGKTEQGYFITFDVLAPHIIAIFNELYKINFAIGGADPFKGASIEKSKIFFTKIIPDDNYNFSGSFSCRGMQSNLGVMSAHSLGMAIDINPLTNPYIEIDTKTKQITKIIPVDGIFYINRIASRPDKPFTKGVIEESIVKIFKANGFNIWGGYWNEPVDNHHFQLTKSFSNFLAFMPFEDGSKLFDINIKLQKFIVAKNLLTNDDIFSAMAACFVKDIKLVQKYSTLTNFYLQNASEFFKFAQKTYENYIANSADFLT